MYEVAVHKIPSRSVLSDRLMRGGVARPEGIAGAPFTIHYGQ